MTEKENLSEVLARLLGEWETTGGNTITGEILGDTYTRAGDFVTARRWYRKALSLAPEKSQLWDKFEDSVIRVLDRAIRKLSPLDTKQTQLKLLQLRYSIRSYERRLQSRPSDSTLHYELGKLHYLLGRTDRAKAEFEVCTEGQKRAEAYFYLARCFMKERQFKAALLHFSKCEESVLSVDLRSDIRFHKAKCLAELGRSGEANDLLGQ
jgi:tetratricopeptide (TPR) repeat protein